jgi:hypothetical protein
MLAALARRVGAGATPWRAALVAAAGALPPASLVRLPSYSTGTAAPSPRRLADILRLDLLADKTGAEVEAIWREFHDATSSKDDESRSGAHRFRLGSTLPAPAYATFASRAAASPLFVLPIAKHTQGQGDEGEGRQQQEGKSPPPGLLTLVTQAQLPHILVGTLGEYRNAPGGPASAPAHAVITHYDELASDKGVVLVRTDIVSPHVLSPAEAAGAVRALHSLYLDDAPGGGHALVRAFNHAPDSFQWEALLEYLGLSGVVGTEGSGGGGGGSGGG